MTTLSYQASMKENVLGGGSGGGSGSGSADAPSQSAHNNAALSKTFSKITVHSILCESNGNTLQLGGPGSTQNTIIRKIKDFGMFGAVNNAAQKHANGTSSTTSTTSTATATNANQTTTTTKPARKRPLGESKSNEANKQATTHKKSKLAKDAAAGTPKLSKRQAQDKPKSKANKSKATATPLDMSLNNAQGSTPTTASKHALKTAGTPGRKGLPLPQAVARRNARERNRVKQVNNGFAALRERIPEEVSEAFESLHNNNNNNNNSTGSCGRSSAAINVGKKLSKVETLRMAVEYIRSLERLLGFDFPPMSGGSGSSSASALRCGNEDSFMLIKDEFDDLSPDNYDDTLSNYDMDELHGYAATTPHSMSAESVPESTAQPAAVPQAATLPSITTLNGLQYVRIPGTNAYQLLTTPNDLYAAQEAAQANAQVYAFSSGVSPPDSSIDEEHFNALIDTNFQSSATAIAIKTTATTTLPTTLTTHTTTAVATATGAINNAAELADAPAVAADATNGDGSNGECVKFTNVALLSRSPVPQMQATTKTTTTTAATTTTTVGSTSLDQQRLALAIAQAQGQVIVQATTTTATTSTASAEPTVSPVAVAAANELLMQATCAFQRQFVATPTHQQQHQHQQQHAQHQRQMQLIKQGYNNMAGSAFINAITATTTPPAAALKTLIYQHAPAVLQQQQQQQPQLLLSHVPITMSPPATAGAAVAMLPMSPGLHSFYEQDHSSFYEGVVNFKKEFNDMLLDTSTTTAGLSDESMIDAIDWWEAHTPKSDGGSVIM